MSILPARSNRDTNLFISGLDDVIDQGRIVNDRTVGNNGVDVASMIGHACLRCEPFVDACKV